MQVGRELTIQAGTTYVFDKAYCDYTWWTRLHDAGSLFVTRKKANATYRVTPPAQAAAKPKATRFTILGDAEVRLATQGRTKLRIPMRRIRCLKARRRADSYSHHQ